MIFSKLIKNLPKYAVVFLGSILFISLPSYSNSASMSPAINLTSRAIETDDLGIMNPTGLAFSPGADLFFVIEDPATKPAGIDVTDIIMITSLEELAGYTEIPIAITNPANVAFDKRSNRLFFYEATTNELIGIPVRADGSLDAAALIRIKTQHWGIQNPRGMTFDPDSGSLFILDSSQGQIMRIEPVPPDSSDSKAQFKNSRISYIDLSQIGPIQLQGIAFNAANGHFYILSPITKQLYELTEKGQVITTYDLSNFDFINPQSMVIAPSADETDDPLEVSLYIADTGIDTQQNSDRSQRLGKIVELSFNEHVESRFLEATSTTCLIQTIDTSEFDPPSPDPAGLVYLSHIDRILISDSEVNEYNYFANANLFEITRDWQPGDPISTGDTTSFSDEPTGVAFNPNNGHYYFSDDTVKQVYDYDPGADTFTSFEPTFSDPEGIAFGTIGGLDYLFVAHGGSAEVAQYTLTGSLVSNFDVEQYGITDPEGVEFNPESGTLFVIDSAGIGEIIETTIRGTLIRTIDISAASAVKPAGITFAPGSLDPSIMNIYIVDRNSDGASPIDGRMYELSLQCGGIDQDISVTPSSLDYGNALIGTSSALTVTIQNVGGEDLNVTGISLGTGSSSEFEITSDPSPVTIASGGNQTVEVTYSPLDVGPDAGTLEIVSDDPDEPVVTVTLTGSGIDWVPDISVTPSSLDYGNVVIGTSPVRNVTIQNIGVEDLNVTGISLGTGSSSEFEITSDPSPVIIGPSGFATVDVTYSPLGLGGDNGILEIFSNDPDEPVVTVTLMGNGIDAPPPGITFHEIQSGGSTSSSSVTTSGSLMGVSNHLYLAAISSKPDVAVNAVSGLGLNWIPVQWQCGGRSQTRMEVWMAQGVPSGDGAVTATLDAVPVNTVIAVSRYSGVDAVSAIGNMVSGNTNGVDGLCSDGADSAAYSLDLTTAVDGSVVYAAVAIRNRQHDPGTAYTEQIEVNQGNGGGMAGIAVQDQMVLAASNVAVDGTFSKRVDWAVVGVEIRPGSGQ
jgi:hypothetical protein